MQGRPILWRNVCLHIDHGPHCESAQAGWSQADVAECHVSPACGRSIKWSCAECGLVCQVLWASHWREHLECEYQWEPGRLSEGVLHCGLGMLYPVGFDVLDTVTMMMMMACCDMYRQKVCIGNASQSKPWRARTFQAQYEWYAEKKSESSSRLSLVFIICSLDWTSW